MLYRIVKLAVLPRYRLHIEFEDGSAGVIDLADDLYGPMFEPLRNEAFFAQAALDEFGAVCWPNGADYAPDAMYDIITGKRHLQPQIEQAARQPQR
jgi:hypothetical protein